MKTTTPLALALAVVASALPIAAGPLVAAGGCELGVRPLLQVVAVSSSQQVATPSEASGGALICTDGSSTRVDVVRPTPDGPQAPGDGVAERLPASVAVVTGTIPTPERAALGRALSAARVGQVESCRLSLGTTLEVAQRITWTGRRGRRNTFVLTTDSDGGPPCSTEVEALFGALQLALAAAGSSPGARALVIL